MKPVLNGFFLDPPKQPIGRVEVGSELLERCAREILRRLGFKIYNGNKITLPRTFAEEKYAVFQYKYETLYKGKGRKDLMVCFRGEKTIVECRYQSRNGSVDEKIPYLIDSWLKSPIDRWVMVISGDFWNTSSGKDRIRYIEDEIQKNDNEHKKFDIIPINAWGKFVKRLWS